MPTRSTSHPSFPEQRGYVRVGDYFSEMVIKSRSKIEELGMDFELTYFDDPKTQLPSSCVNWVASSGNTSIGIMPSSNLLPHANGTWTCLPTCNPLSSFVIIIELWAASLGTSWKCVVNNYRGLYSRHISNLSLEKLPTSIRTTHTIMVKLAVT